MGKRGPASPENIIRGIGEEISRTHQLNESHKAAIKANLALLQNNGGSNNNRGKANTLSGSMKYLLESESLRNILLAYLAFPTGLYKLNKDTRQPKSGQISVQNLRHHRHPITLCRLSQNWVSQQFKALSHDVKPDEHLISRWLDTMTPEKETLVDIVLKNLNDGMQIGVCQEVLASQITERGLVDLHSEPELSAGWDGYAPRLIRGGAQEFFSRNRAHTTGRRLRPETDGYNDRIGQKTRKEV